MKKTWEMWPCIIGFKSITENGYPINTKLQIFANNDEPGEHKLYFCSSVLFLEWRLAYTKRLLWEAEPSRAEPRRAIQGYPPPPPFLFLSPHHQKLQILANHDEPGAHKLYFFSSVLILVVSGNCRPINDPAPKSQEQQHLWFFFPWPTKSRTG